MPDPDLALTSATTASPFIAPAWYLALQGYPGDLPHLINGILSYGARLGVTESQDIIGRIVKNQVPSELDTAIVTAKLHDDLGCNRISIGTEDTVCSALYYVPKSDGGWRRIHNLSSP